MRTFVFASTLHAPMLPLRNLVPLLERSQPTLEKQDKPAS
jgi:hypothetical protein